MPDEDKDSIINKLLSELENTIRKQRNAKDALNKLTWQRKLIIHTIKQRRLMESITLKKEKTEKC
jgi:hypothetical protein